MMPEMPAFPFQITLVGGRKMYVWEENPKDEDPQITYSTTDLRCWTHNGETLCRDVLLTLMAGAEKVEHFPRNDEG